MRFPHSSSLICGVVVAAGGCASPRLRAADTSPEAGLSSLIAAERAFARHSERAGIKESFIANLGGDGILFRPGPVNGLEWFRDRPASRGYLSWEPEVAAIAASGELGYTTGPWEFRARGAADTVSGAGHYVTVWRRDSSRTWKMALDIGTAHRWVPRPSEAPGKVLGTVYSLGGDARQALIVQDSALGAAGAPQSADLLGAMLDDARVHRQGAVPALGMDAIRAALHGDDRPYHAKPLGSGVSRAADFGYTYGEYELVPTFNRSAERGFYLRIWRPGPDGGWRIMLDLAQPGGGGGGGGGS
jgi:ketosteroid isomerase-like protein